MRRAIVVMLAALVVILVGCSTGETQRYPDARGETSTAEGSVGRAARQVEDSTAETRTETEATAEEPTIESRCYREKEDEIRIGDFEPPEEEVPAYEIIEEETVERDGAEAVRLLVDTQARSEEDYTLITRELKARYAEIDAASIEFTDTTGTLSYNGGAAIFNTPCGSDYIGYVYRPPNNEGYRVTAAQD